MNSGCNQQRSKRRLQEGCRHGMPYGSVFSSYLKRYGSRFGRCRYSEVEKNTTGNHRLKAFSIPTMQSQFPAHLTAPTLGFANDSLTVDASDTENFADP